MKIQVLPHWCKKGGIILFLLCSFIGGLDAANEAYKSAYRGVDAKNCREVEKQEVERKGKFVRIEEDAEGRQKVVKGNFKSEKIEIKTEPREIFQILSLVFLLITLFAKEKYEDEFLNLLRLKSFHLTTVICLGFCLLLSFFDVDSRISIGDITFVYVVLYLIIFRIQKSRIDLA